MTSWRHNDSGTIDAFKGSGLRMLYVRLLSSALILCIALPFLAGCGPYRSRAALRDAEFFRGEVVNLKDQGRSHKRVAYIMAKGNAFLHQARLSAGHSDHSGAISFAQIARESFVEAVTLLESSADPEPSTPTGLPDNPDIAPPPLEAPAPPAPLPAEQPSMTTEESSQQPPTEPAPAN